MWLWNILGICSIEIKIVLTLPQDFEFINHSFDSIPPPVPSHFVPVGIQLLDQNTGLKLYAGFKEKTQPGYKVNLSDLC